MSSIEDCRGKSCFRSSTVDRTWALLPAAPAKQAGKQALTQHAGQGQVPVGDVKGGAVLRLLQHAVHRLQSELQGWNTGDAWLSEMARCSASFSTTYTACRASEWDARELCGSLARSSLEACCRQQACHQGAAMHIACTAQDSACKAQHSTEQRTLMTGDSRVMEPKS